MEQYDGLGLAIVQHLQFFGFQVGDRLTLFIERDNAEAHQLRLRGGVTSARQQDGHKSNKTSHSSMVAGFRTSGDGPFGWTNGKGRACLPAERARCFESK